MTLDPTQVSTLLGGAASAIAAIVFALRSRVRIAEKREEKRLEAEDEAEKARTRRENETRDLLREAREDLAATQIRAGLAESRAHDFELALADARADHELACALCGGNRRRSR